MSRGRRGAPPRRARLPGARAALSAAGLGGARSGRDLGERREAPPRTLWRTRASGRVSSPRSGSRTSARRRSSGSDVRAALSTAPSCGRTAAPPRGARELPAELIRERTGLVPDPYFSATKLEWILGRTDIPQRELAFGTVDTWLVWKLTGGAAHITDVTNASRTMLLDLAARRVGRRAARALRRRALVAAVDRRLVGHRRRSLAAGGPRADRRDRRRPAGRALRPGVLRARRREGDLRHGNVRARQPRRALGDRRERRAGDGCRRRAGCAGPVRRRGIRARRRRRARVAA